MIPQVETLLAFSGIAMTCTITILGAAWKVSAAIMSFKDEMSARFDKQDTKFDKHAEEDQKSFEQIRLTLMKHDIKLSPNFTVNGGAYQFTGSNGDG